QIATNHDRQERRLLLQGREARADLRRRLQELSEIPGIGLGGRRFARAARRGTNERRSCNGVFGVGAGDVVEGWAVTNGTLRMTNDERNAKVGIGRRALPILLTAAAVVGLSACSSKPVVSDKPMKPETLQQEIGYAGLGQETVIDPVTTNATVVALDAAQRLITLKYADGSIAPYKAGPEVGNFNDLKVGDQVKLTAV